MAKAWIRDRWVKDATVTLPDGTNTKLAPSAKDMRNIKTLPEHFRADRYGEGKRWQVVWRDDEGKMRSRSFDQKNTAAEHLAFLEDAIRAGRYVAPEHAEQTFRELAETWLASKHRPKPATIRRYTRELETYVLPRWGSTPINKITRQEIEAWVRDLVNGTDPRVYKTERESKPLAARYLRHIVGKTFGAALRYASEEGWLQRNPLQRVELPRPKFEEDGLVILTYQEAENLARAAGTIGSQADRALAYLLAYSGPRANEALALKVGDIDLAKRRAKVLRTWTLDIDGRRTIGPPKTWQRREIPLADFVCDELKPLMAGRNKDDWLFRAPRGTTAVDLQNWRSRVWKKALEAVELEDSGLTIHKLRHTAASSAIGAGADVKVVQQMLGHADATETLNTYGHLWPDRLDEVIGAVASARSAALDLAA